MKEGFTTASKIRSFISKALATVIVYVVVVSTLQVVLFAPLAGASHVQDFLPFVTELILAVTSSILLFSHHYKAAVALAYLLALASFAYWWFVICRNTKPIWSDFRWLIVPNLFFAVAVHAYRYNRQALHSVSTNASTEAQGA
ncbi:MAG TPA: hypothetical protein VFA99_04165 [Acidobacteriaceae bacterium]|nr:hypothetical protein [Acidobacteriaceae bacterium]